MAIIVNIDVMLAKRKMSVSALAEAIGMSLTNLSLLKTGKVKGFRFATLGAICAALDCQPGDLLEFRPDPAEAESGAGPAQGVRSKRSPVTG